MMPVIVTVCVALDRTVSETEIGIYERDGCRMPPTRSVSRQLVMGINKRPMSFTAVGSLET